MNKNNIQNKKKIEEGKDYIVWKNAREELSYELKNKLKNLEVENNKISLKKAKLLVEEGEVDSLLKIAVEIKLEDFLNYLYDLKYLTINSEGLLLTEIGLTEKTLENLISVIKNPY